MPLAECICHLSPMWPKLSTILYLVWDKLLTFRI
jgi:hypothetical protein